MEAAAPEKKKKSSKMTRPVTPPPPQPPPPPVAAQEAVRPPPPPPGIDAPASNASAAEGYGRPSPPPVPSASSSNAAAAAAGPATAAEGQDDPSRKRTMKNVFEPHIDAAAIEKGLKAGKLIRGTLRIANAKPSNAYVQPDGCKPRENDILVKGRAARNRSVNGDVVIIELIQDGDAALRGSAAPELEEEDEDADIPRFRPPPGLASDGSSSEDEVLFGGKGKDEDDEKQNKGGKGDGKGKNGKRKGGKGKDSDDFKQMQLGMVVAISDPKGRDRVMVCTLHPNTKSRGKKQEGAEEPEEEASDMVLEGDNVLRAMPTDNRMPWVLIQVNETTKNVLNIPGRLDKYKLWPVQIVKWVETSHLPLGRLKGECLGTAGDLEAEERHALIEHELDTHDVDFDDDLLDEVEAIVQHADADFENEARRRLDLRKKRIFTIDPATARDLDDAIHVDLVPGGKQVEIGVHIADVGHFLKLGSIADKEAQKRTTSVYLINRVLPMLPHALCNHLCSLNPNEPKVSFSAFFRIDRATGDLIEDPPPWFKKTVMSSVCRLNYDEVQELLDGYDIEPPPMYGGHKWADIQEDIKILEEVCGKVRTGRLTGGAMSITKAKMVFHTRESEDGVPTGYHLEEHSASHWIIEELMLLANRCVAKHLAFSALSSSSVLRNHKCPDKKKAETLDRLMINNLGLEWDGSSAGAIYKCCQTIYKKYGEVMGQCVEMMVMRCGMQQAEYSIFGTEDQDPHHFALDFDYYTHFTSPIRRYPDVMVHRVLAALLADPSEFQEEKVGADQCDICNTKRTASRKCQEQLDRSVFCIYLRARKEWFYTVGTVLGFKEDQAKGQDIVTIYSSQLGKEKKVLLCTSTEAAKLELYKDLNEDDELMLPETWKFGGKGALDLTWDNPGAPGTKRVQKLKVFSCIPVVIIPTNTVPIDFAMFIVSPFHKKFDPTRSGLSTEAETGFDFKEDEDEDGVEVVHDSNLI